MTKLTGTQNMKRDRTGDVPQFQDLIEKAIHGERADSLCHLRHAEELICDPCEWAILSETWIAVRGYAGMKDAKRCVAEISADDSHVVGLLMGAAACYRISHYDEQYRTIARKYMTEAESCVVAVFEATMCAETWAKCDREIGASRAKSFMHRAEALYWQVDGDPEDIILAWVSCFGSDQGTPLANLFRQKMESGRLEELI